MKATLEFDDKQDLLIALNGPEAFTLLSMLDNLIRTQLKHGDPETDRDKLQEVRSEITNFLERFES
jgi:hypothetical protein